MNLKQISAWFFFIYIYIVIAKKQNKIIYWTILFSEINQIPALNYFIDFTLYNRQSGTGEFK